MEPNKNIRVLVTGFPRSGTKWLSRAFEAVGLKVGHEKWHENGGVGYMFSYTKNRERFLDADIVAHQIRDPRYSIASAMKNLHETTQLVKPFGGNWFDAWIYWNLKAELICLQAKNHGVPAYRYSISDGRAFVEMVCERAFGAVPNVIDWPPNNTNHRQECSPLSWNSLSPGVLELAVRYGFGKSDQPKLVKL